MASKMGRPRWPIEEYLARTKWSRRMVRCLKRAHPDGKVEGELPRGVTQVMHDRAVELARRRPAAAVYWNADGADDVRYSSGAGIIAAMIIAFAMEGVESL